MPAALFANLAEELIAHIVDFIHDPRDLCNISLVSKQLSRITAANIYEHVSLRFDAQTLNRITRVKRLTKLFLSHPELTVLVKKFSVRSAWRTRYKDTQEWRSDVDDDTKAAIKKHARNNTEYSDWVDSVACNFGTEDSRIALLIPEFTKLKSLSLMLQDETPTSWYDLALLRSAQTGEGGFNNLEEVMLAACGDTMLLSMICVSPYFRLPRMKRVFVHSVTSDWKTIVYQGNGLEFIPDNLGELYSQPELTNSAVEHIEFRQCHLNERDLRQLAFACHSLRTFILELGENLEIVCNPANILKALAPCKETLQNLWLDVTVHFQVEDLEDLRPLSFTDFTSLVHLKLAPIFLLGSDASELDSTELFVKAIPASLEKLSFVKCELNFTVLHRVLQSLLSTKAVRHPSLNQLRIEGPFSRSGGWWDELFELKSLAEEPSVSLEVWDNRYGPEGTPFFIPEEDMVERGWGMDEDIIWTDCDDNSNARWAFKRVPLTESDKNQIDINGPFPVS
ncbi:hypothetical protein K432DRAFT_463686 [Lepidopterella palustris CBS 459.81]|uniref:F-box domain-containing protein n=1 Tax=Lepidopterella palustris CBS 459.81 TaxID=1314670 RepID=A0A8E2E2L8_9PEZI|nr:hypothetical protein K432DRAFT_463686 [Lepidopterella palustris CBS 459.81]